MALIIEDLGGNCPVQAEGFFDGVPFYFRARGSHWSLTVGVAGETQLTEWFEEYCDDPYGAGWMEEEEARQFIQKCYDEWVLVDRPRIWYPISERMPKIMPEASICLFNRAMDGDGVGHPYLIVNPAWMDRLGSAELISQNYTHWMLMDDPESIRKTYFKPEVYGI